MPNDYYDFNPSATTWVLMLSGMVLFVVVLSLLLIYLVHRSGQATAASSAPAVAGTAPRDNLAAVPEPARTVTAGHHAPPAKAS